MARTVPWLDLFSDAALSHPGNRAIEDDLLRCYKPKRNFIAGLP